MANDCLVTRLKVSTNNPDLPILNRIRLKKRTGTSNIYFKALDRAHQLSVIVSGDYIADYNGNIQNQTFTVNVPWNQEARVGISSAAGEGYFDIVFDNTTVYDKVLFRLNFMESVDTFESLSMYSPYFLINLLQQGSYIGGNPKFSEWLNLVDENASLIANLITTVNTYQTNVQEDEIDYAKLGKLINVTNITNLNTLVPATIAAAMVSNGRTSGTMSIITSVVVTVKFGSSMTNPTSQETAQGYQIS